MIAELLAGYVGVILSLVFSYVPGVEAWYKALEGTTKRLIMLGLLVLVTAAIFGVSCAGLGGDFGISVECSKAGVMGLLQVLFAAIIGNQAVFLISPKT